MSCEQITPFTGHSQKNYVLYAAERQREEAPNTFHSDEPTALQDATEHEPTKRPSFKNGNGNGII